MGVGRPVNRVRGAARVSQLRRAPGAGAAGACAVAAAARPGRRARPAGAALRPRGARRRGVVAPAQRRTGASGSRGTRCSTSWARAAVGAVRPRLHPAPVAADRAAARSLAIDAGLWLWDSTLQWYVGSSGVLHGVPGGRHAGAPAAARAGRLDPAAVLAGKLCYEHAVGPLPFSGSAGRGGRPPVRGPRRGGGWPPWRVGRARQPL